MESKFLLLKYLTPFICIIVEKKCHDFLALKSNILLNLLVFYRSDASTLKVQDTSTILEEIKTIRESEEPLDEDIESRSKIHDENFDSFLEVTFLIVVFYS